MISSILIVLLFVVTDSFRLKSANLKRHHLCMRLSSDNEISQELQYKLENAEFFEAYQLLRKNPMLPVGLDEAKSLLNNIDDIVSVQISDFQERQQKVSYFTSDEYINSRLHSMNSL